MPPVYPEGDYVAVFCCNCGSKNRQDPGWRYRDDPVRRATEMAMLRASRTDFFRLGITSWARLSYQCPYCRNDRQAIQQRSVQQQEEDERPIAHRTRERLKMRQKQHKRRTTLQQGNTTN